MRIAIPPRCVENLQDGQVTADCTFISCVPRAARTSRPALASGSRTASNRIAVRWRNTHTFFLFFHNCANLRILNDLSLRYIAEYFSLLSITYTFLRKFVISRSAVQLRSSAPVTPLPLP